jgi:hypothetical protein
MGSELSCPCGNRIDFEEPQRKKPVDILQEINLGKLQAEEMLYEYSYSHTKSCLIKTEQLEGFFKNRNLLIMPSNTGNYSSYYNIMFLTNFGPIADTIFILMQYNQNIDDKSFRTSMYTKSLNVSFV